MKSFWFILFAWIPQITLADDIEGGLRRLLNEAKDDPTKENLMRLADKIKGSYRYQSKITSSALEATNEVRDGLCKIPGHARFIAEEIERKRSEFNLNNDFRACHDPSILRYFQTLAHLRSPESVQVLGNYLNDERDAAKEASWDSHGMLWGIHPMSTKAADSLMAIGLRDLGFTEPSVEPQPSANDYAGKDEWRKAMFEHYVAARETRLEPWRTWWQDVKNGRKAFSFTGQAMEFRFKPDGTWETIPILNQPVDQSNTVSQNSSEASRAIAPEKIVQDQSSKLRLWTILLIAAGVMTGLWWLWRVFRRV